MIFNIQCKGWGNSPALTLNKEVELSTGLCLNFSLFLPVISPFHQYLESILGIGLLSSRVLLGALDNAQRFDDRKAVCKYGALTPTIYQSGSMTNLGRINRYGRHEAGRVLLQCATQLRE